MTAPDWTDDALADLARDYPADTHDDVADLIAGVRAVLRLHPETQHLSYGDGGPERPVSPTYCRNCYEPWPCEHIRALNHPEETP